MFAETARKLKEKLLKEGEINAKKRILINQLLMKYGLTEDEKDRIRNIQSPVLLDSALDAVVTGKDKQGLLDLLG